MSDQKQPISGDQAFDKARDYAQDNPDTARSAIDKVEDLLDQRTGGTFSGAIDKGGDFIEDKLGLPSNEGGTAPNPSPGTGDPQPQQDPTAPADPGTVPDTTAPSTIPGEGDGAPSDPSFPPPDAEPPAPGSASQGESGGLPQGGSTQQGDPGSAQTPGGSQPADGGETIDLGQDDSPAR